MEFRNLKRQYQALKAEIDRGMQDVIDSTDFISGKKVAQLEERLAAYVGTKHCICCANGTDAMSLALMAWGIGPGDAVFVPDFTFFSSGEVVALQGAEPVFVDVREDTFNLDADRLREAIQQTLEEKRSIPKAVLVVDLFGQPADYARIKSVADEFGLLLLEDGAQGFGGEIHGRRACSFGDISTTSFFPAKPLGCYGDGGAVFTDNDTWAKILYSLRIHGKGSCKYDNVRIGMNSRLDTLQAAVLLAKLDALERYELERVNDAAKKYDKRLHNVVKTPVVPDGYLSSWAQYTIRLENAQRRDGLQAYLKEHGIPSMVYYPKPMHRQEAFIRYGRNELAADEGAQRFAVTESLCKTVLSLPMHPYIEDEEIIQVTNCIKDYQGILYEE